MACTKIVAAAVGQGCTQTVATYNQTHISPESCQDDSVCRILQQVTSAVTLTCPTWTIVRTDSSPGPITNHSDRRR